MTAVFPGADASSTTSRSFRRPERTRRPFIVALATEHVIAKFVALLFAAVLIWLIDREIAVVLFDGELPVRVVASAQSGPAARDARNEILLTTEDGVAIHRLGASRARVVVRGRKKLADLVRGPGGSVFRGTIRQSWLAGGYTSRQLDGSELDVGAAVESIRLDQPLQVDFDAEIERDLPLAAEFKNVTSGLMAKATFNPPSVKVAGAAAWLNGAGAVSRVLMTIDCAGRSDPFVTNVNEPPEDLRRKFVRFASGAGAEARVSFDAADDELLRIEGVPLRFVGSGASELTFTPLPPLDAARPSVTVVLRGPSEEIARYETPQAMDELRRRLQAQVDTDVLARAAAGYLDDVARVPPEESVAVEVLRIPDGLKFDHADRVEVRIKRRAP